MKTKTINLYQFHELTKEQQAKVLDKYRDFNDDITCDLVNHDEIHIIKLVEKGFLNPDISYSLSYCQGDGASFTCSKLDYELLLKDYKCKHKSWIIQILKEYCEVKIERSCCHYYHKRSCNTELYEYTQGNYPHIMNELENIRQHIENARIYACDDLEEGLQAEIDYLTSDECIAETLIANEYYFNEDTLEIEY